MSYAAGGFQLANSCRRRFSPSSVTSPLGEYKMANSIGRPPCYMAHPPRLCAHAGRLSTGASGVLRTAMPSRIVLDGPEGRCYDDLGGRLAQLVRAQR